MSTLSISRMVVPLMAIGTATVVTVVFADRFVRTQAADDHAIVATAPAPPAPQPATKERDQEPAKFAAVQAETDRLATTLDTSTPPDRGADTPEFDVASIQPTGEAVIAGRAAPGATVELLRNGELHDRTVADQAGQFVMIPRPLPPGTYDLTLHSKQTDGKEATSKQRVAVALESPKSQQPVVASAKPNELPVQPAPPAAQAPVSSKLAVEAGKVEPRVAVAHTRSSGSAGTAAPRPPRLAAAEAAVLPGMTPPLSTAIGPKGTTATVSRGDSLWRISQRALGSGARYGVLYNANRERIRNADLIYPGQVFVLPGR